MKRGIDVSTHQGVINWAQVKADGVDFAMVKATQGRSVTGTYRDFTDSKFASNITGAHRWGIRCGVYHYLTAQTVPEAMHEAEYFLSVIEPYRSIIDLYAAVDVEEDKYLPKDKTLLTQIVYAFCSRVQAAGYDPIIYTNPNYLKYRLNDVSKYPLWLALWRSKTNVPTVKQYPSMRMWQWGKEDMDGINGEVDANFMIAEKPEEVPELPKSETVEKPAASGQDNAASEWSAEAVKWCVDNGILLGDQNGDLMLHQPMTREQACLVVKRMYDKLLEDAVDAVASDIAGRLMEALK
jgi:GH25 family lysozyme M1 (1,4-beta-N-acetylmuramidase)